MVVAAGPLASLLVAPLCLLLPLPTWEAACLSLFVFADAIEDLVPNNVLARDGTKLWRLPQQRRASVQVRGLLAEPDWLGRPDSADILIAGFRLDAPEADDSS